VVREFADISSYQDVVRASRYAAAGHALLAVKATEGTSWVDPNHGENAARAHGAGLDVWHYHFAHPDTDPDAVGEVSHFWRTVRPHYQPGDRLVLDVELHHPEGPAGLVRYTHALDTHVIRISGVHPVLYTYDALLRETGPTWQVVSGDWWIANYGGRVRRLGYGRRMIAQQYTDGTVGGDPKRFAGIGQCDGDRLQRWYARRLAKERAARRKLRH
jgi:GH25 family lysozyme M1 (1,4-beta-N-acetylmuramidase)